MSRIDPEEQSDVLHFLALGTAFGLSGPPKRIDTHAASVFLAGDRVWKLKRAVRYDYLDFSTAELRRLALERELRLNRRTAPGLYHNIHPITCDSSGRLAIDGDGEPVDWLLEMTRFPDDCLFEHMAEQGRLDAALLIRLADHLVSFHAVADPLQAANGAAMFQRIIEGNAVSMMAFPALLDQDRVKFLVDRLHRLFGELAPLLDARARAERVRHGHGDLHLGNIALIDGQPTLFDCLEFSAELATVDVLYDLAFLLMDLWQRGLKDEASIIFNRYLDLSSEDEEGIALMPLFLATRAAIRAHVLAAKSERLHDPGAGQLASGYLALALEFTQPVSPALVAIGGLSGTGKSTLARALASAVGRPPGARIVRSDVLRKQIAGYPPETRLSPDDYSSDANARVYALLTERTAAALAAGQAAIADAVFSQPDERKIIEYLAPYIPFVGLWLDAPIEERIARLSARSTDASDAGEAVARAQMQIEIGKLRGWHIVKSTVARDRVTMAAQSVLSRAGISSQN